MLKRLRILLEIIVVLWVIEYVDQALFGGGLDRFGLHPGKWEIWEPFVMPFLHGSYEHLLGNTIAMVIFGSLLLLRGWSDMIYATACAVIASGVVVIVLGQDRSVHIGASGVVFGWWAYLIIRGLYEKSILTISCSVVVLYFYSHLALGMLPGQSGISWQAHLGGALGGSLAALIGPTRKQPSKNRTPSMPNTIKISGVSVGAGALYALMPVDLITDVIPVIGWLDDLCVGLISASVAFSSIYKYVAGRIAQRKTNAEGEYQVLVRY